MTAELITLPSQEELREQAYQIWSIKANRSAQRTRQILEQVYVDFPDLGLPMESTIRCWITRDEWHARATRELAEGYPAEARAFRWGLWRMLQASQEVMWDDLTGVRPMGKITHANIKLLWEACGVGAKGFNQGGEITLSFEGMADEMDELSVDERLRRLRAGYVDAHTGHG